MEAYYGIALTYLRMGNLTKSFLYSLQSIKFNPSLSVSFCLITYLFIKLK
jgi:hypothetical protein